MNNFNILKNLNHETSLIILEDSELSVDDRYLLYYRGKFNNIKEVLDIMKNTISLKIMEKELNYKNELQIDKINKDLNLIFENIQLYSTNVYHDENEQEQIILMLKDLILLNKEIDKKNIGLNTNLNVFKIFKTSNDYNNDENNERFCYYKSLSKILFYIKNYCLIAKNKTLQGIRYAKIKFIQYAGNINLYFVSSN